MVKLIALYSATHYKNPNVGIYQVVKALELIFHPHFHMATGSYSWVESLSDGDGKSHQVASIPYAWLVVNELDSVIIDAMPFSQPANLKVPVLVMLKQKDGNLRNFGYFSGPLPNGGPERRKLLSGVKRTVNIFEDILRREGI